MKIDLSMQDSLQIQHPAQPNLKIQIVPTKNSFRVENHPFPVNVDYAEERYISKIVHCFDQQASNVKDIQTFESIQSMYTRRLKDVEAREAKIARNWKRLEVREKQNEDMKQDLLRRAAAQEDRNQSLICWREELEQKEQTVEREERLNSNVAGAQNKKEKELEQREATIKRTEETFDIRYEQLRTQEGLAYGGLVNRHGLISAKGLKDFFKGDPDGLFRFELPDGTQINLLRKHLKSVEGSDT